MNNSNGIRPVVIALLLGLTTLPAIALTEVHGDTGAAMVSLGDLDLSTAGGRRTAHDRVEQTARRLCGKLRVESDRSSHSNYLACVDDAVGNAMQKLQRSAADFRLPR